MSAEKIVANICNQYCIFLNFISLPWAAWLYYSCWTRPFFMLVGGYFGDIYYYALLMWISPIAHCKCNLSKEELIVF